MLIWGKEGCVLHDPQENLVQWTCKINLRFIYATEDSREERETFEKVTSAWCSVLQTPSFQFSDMLTPDDTPRVILL